MTFLTTLSCRLCLIGLALVLGSGAVSAEQRPRVSIQGLTMAEGPEQSAYRVGTGDRVKVAVFDEKELSSIFIVSAEQGISLPLIGGVGVGGMSLREVENAIVFRLKDGYLKDPQVSVEVLNYRPFYILGEVHRPGSYPYVGNMTELNAVALGGGYTHRAKKGQLFMTRATDPERLEKPVKTTDIVRPGDVIRVAERFF